VIVSPATAVVLPSVLVIDRSASGSIVVVSVAALSPGSGSVTPAGAMTVAVFVATPAAEPATVPEIVKVTLSPTARSTSAARSPLPFGGTGQLDPGSAAHVQVAPAICAGIGSVTVAPATADGPAFVTTTVYTTGSPGRALVSPSLFTTDRSAVGVRVLVSVLVLSAGVSSVTVAGGVTVAVLVSVPSAAGSMSPVSS
jgi:hypothetical protein